VTVTSTVPAACPGLVAVIFELETTVKLVALTVPNLTFVTVSSVVPVIVTAVPPPVEPEAGETLVMVGVTAKVYWSAEEVALVPPDPVTVTSTVFAPVAGVTAVICVEETRVKLVAAPFPNITEVTPVKLVPVIVTAVPPAVVPERGLIPVTAGVTA
jgi:hypothetical protein